MKPTPNRCPYAERLRINSDDKVKFHSISKRISISMTWNLCAYQSARIVFATNVRLTLGPTAFMHVRIHLLISNDEDLWYEACVSVMLSFALPCQMYAKLSECGINVLSGCISHIKVWLKANPTFVLINSLFLPQQIKCLVHLRHLIGFYQNKSDLFGFVHLSADLCFATNTSD